MSTPDPQLLAALAPLASLSDADALVAVNAPTVTPRPYYVSHRTMLSVCCTVDPTNGVGAAEYVARFIQSAAPATYVVYIQAGATDGSSGGLDVSEAATAGFLSLIVQASASDVTAPAKFTAPMRDAALSLGSVTTYPAGWVRTLDEVTAARAYLARRDAANAALTAIEQWASYARGVVDAYAAGTAEALPTVPT